MDSYDIAISGLGAAQQAFEVIGNNIANAATEGYHRQELNLTSSYSKQVGSMLFGGGVDTGEVSRVINNFLEKEIYRQQSSLGYISQELDTLRTVETMFGELSSDGGLNAAMDDFFNALKELAAHPLEIIYQEQAVSAAESMTNKFHILDDYLTTIECQITQEAESVIQEINSLVESIAVMNSKIETIEISGGKANNLCDQRDRCIAQLSELIDVEVQSQDYGVVNICIAGIPVLTGTSSVELEVGLNQAGDLSISIAGESAYYSEIQGGRLGGLISLKNTLVSDIHSDLNSLAAEMIQQINQYHVQGVGSEGSFTNLTGWTMIDEDFADFEASVSDGGISIRVTNVNTGEVTRTTIPVDISEDSLTSLAADIAAITGISASVYDSKLRIQADSGYEFDFLPAVLPEQTDSDFTGAVSPPEISVSGIYSETENQTFTFTVSGSGSVGNGALQITVTNGDGDIIKTFSIGSGYAAGDKLELGNGIEIALGTGDLADGNTFEVDAFARSDTTGILAAIGINTFFSGINASDIAVSSDICNAPGRIATSIGPDMTDNENISRLAGLEDAQFTNLNSMTIGEFYREMVTEIGLDVSTRSIRQENVEATIQNLSSQQSELSGVNINDEAARLLIFEQMFQAMSKYLAAIQNSLSTLMEII
ncbi:MAG: flagellar hook-associated protein FlgK [Sedimentisphaerales bacterium]|nr:flagellar hook-associated protein FlgK [Sedimentisphaerales bacterium]